MRSHSLELRIQHIVLRYTPALLTHYGRRSVYGRPIKLPHCRNLRVFAVGNRTAGLWREDRPMFALDVFPVYAAPSSGTPLLTCTQPRAIIAREHP